MTALVPFAAWWFRDATELPEIDAAIADAVRWDVTYGDPYLQIPENVTVVEVVALDQSPDHEPSAWFWITASGELGVDVAWRIRREPDV